MVQKKTCPICTTHTTNMKRHMTGQHGDKLQFPCDVCNKTFTQKFHMKTHKDRMHLGNRNKHPCTFCTHSSNSRSDLKTHQLTHQQNEPTPCNKCDKEFTHARAMRIHVNRVHAVTTVEFNCNICLRKFRTKAELKQHTEVHKKEKQFKCDQCPREFKRNAQLTSHKKKKHVEITMR